MNNNYVKHLLCIVSIHMLLNGIFNRKTDVMSECVIVFVQLI